MGNDMNNKNNLKVALTVIAVLLILFGIGISLYSIFVKGEPLGNVLIRFIIIVLSAVVAIARINTDRPKSLPLEQYEKAYAEELGTAFCDQTMNRTKLLCAVRLYNESKYRKALKYLLELLPTARTDKDRIPVFFFMALCYSDGGAPLEAVVAYESLLKIEPCHAQAHSNLGLIYVKLEEGEKGLYHYDRSLECDPNNYYAWVNRANYYFRLREYESAITDALRAMELKNNGVEAASLLAVSYALTGKNELMEKYFHTAVVLGKSPDDLNASIDYFRHTPV